MPSSVFRVALYSLSSHFGSLALVLMPQPRRHLSLLLTQPQALWARSVGGGRGCASLPHQAHRPITCRQKELANRFYNGTLRAVTQDHKPLSSAGASTARSAGPFVSRCTCDAFACARNIWHTTKEYTVRRKPQVHHFIRNINGCASGKRDAVRHTFHPVALWCVLELKLRFSLWTFGGIWFQMHSRLTNISWWLNR